MRGVSVGFAVRAHPLELEKRGARVWVAVPTAERPLEVGDDAGTKSRPQHSVVEGVPKGVECFSLGQPKATESSNVLVDVEGSGPLSHVEGTEAMGSSVLGYPAGTGEAILFVR